MRLKKWLSLLTVLMMLLSFTIPAYAQDSGSFNCKKPSTNTYGVVGEREITLKIKATGGVLPYEADLNIYLNGECVLSKFRYVDNGDVLSYMPKKAGDYRVTITIRDGAKASASYEFKIPVSPKPRTEYPENWEATMKNVQLTGNYANDLLAIAKSQLGYTADQSSFRVDEYGKHYYTRYGEWYGAPYSEWCVMFITFCAHYANVPESVLPRDASASSLMNYMINAGVYHAKGSGYVPSKGDIIFMDYKGNGTATHAGIVDYSSGDTVYTVEGNTSQGVASKSYALDNSQLVGFGSFQALLNRAGL